MTWNYRVISHPALGIPEEEGERIYKIHEVYSDESGIIGHSEDGIEPFGESKKELIQDLAYMAQAFEKPVLKVEDLNYSSHIGSGGAWGE